MRYEDRSPAKNKFYNSTAWRKLSAYYAASKGWICECCHNKNVDHNKPIYGQLHCHHKEELTEENINDPNVALNEDNLILLCRTCHNKIHGESEVLAPGLIFDANGMPRKKNE